MKPIPTYLHGGPSRRNAGLSRLGTPLFVAAIVAANYWVFVADDSPEAAIVPPQRMLKAPQAEEPVKEPGVTPAPAEPKSDELDRVPARVVKGKLQKGEIIGRALTDKGIPAERFQTALAAMDPLVNFRRSRVGDRYRVELNQAGQVLRVAYSRSPVEKFEAVLDDEGKKYAARAVEVPIRREPLQVGCTVQGTLYDSMVRCLDDAQLAGRVIELLSYDLNYYEDVRDGDAVRLLVDREYVNGRFYRFGPIHGLEYKGKFQTVRAFHFRPEGSDDEAAATYFHADGRSVRRTFLQSPLQYTRVSSGYQKRRFHPVLHKYRKHLAIDYAAPVGTPVWTTSAGKVVYRGRRGASGNLVVVKHDKGYRTYYAHLHRFARNLKVGEQVEQGEVIGYVGATGRATGPHLHYAMKHRGRTINPLKVESESVAQLPEEHATSFAEVVRRRTAELAAIEVLPPGRRRL